MKKYLLIIVVFLGITVSKSFAQNFAWADSVSGTYSLNVPPTGYGLCTDDSENVYAIYNEGNLNYSFLSKYSNGGRLLWTKAGVSGNAVAVDKWRNCYVTGSYFFEKYNSLGQLVLRDSAMVGNSPINFIGNAISYDGGKYLYIAGAFSASSGTTVIFGSKSITFGVNPMGFILKCDTLGNVIWVNSSERNNNNLGGGFIPFGINSNTKGLIYVTGYFADSVMLGAVQLNSNLASTVAFVACYDTAGNVKWANSANRYESWGSAISTDAVGYIYITGAANSNCFIAKYKSTGDSIWWRECNGYSWGFGIATNSSGTSFITGAYQGATFGSLRFPYGGSDMDVFIVEYDSSGNAIWGYDPNDTLTNSIDNWGLAVTTDKSDCNFYFTGVLQTPGRFGNKIIYRWSYLTELQNGCLLTNTPNQTQSKETTKVYPNPFTSSTTILFNENRKHQLEVEDMTGRNLQQFECNGQQYELQRGNLTSGMYFIKVTDEQKNVSVSKILVQ